MLHLVGLSTHWVGPRALPDGCGREKLFHLLEFEPATIKSLSGPYNDYAIPISRLNFEIMNTVFVNSDPSSKAGVRYNDQEVL